MRKRLLVLLGALAHILPALATWHTPTLPPLRGEGKAVTIPIVFGRTIAAEHTRSVVLLNESGTPVREVMPEADGFTYKVPENAELLLKVVPQTGHVAYLWQQKLAGKFADIPRHYSKKEYRLKGAQAGLEVEVAFRKLVATKFEVFGAGSKGKEVNVEEQGKAGALIQPKGDGITYMLPLGAGIYFDPLPAKGYQILIWYINGAESFPRPDVYYKQNLHEGFVLQVELYKEGDKRTVTFTQPLTAALTCKNRSQSGDPKILSGSQVAPGDIILFEVVPFENPSGKVDVHHWEINGESYKDPLGDYYRSNSLTLRALRNLEVKVIPTAESGVEHIARNPHGLKAYYVHAESAIRVENATSGQVELFDLSGKHLASTPTIDGRASFVVESGMHTVYFVRDGKNWSKVLL